MSYVLNREIYHLYIKAPFHVYLTSELISCSGVDHSWSNISNMRCDLWCKESRRVQNISLLVIKVLLHICVPDIEKLWANKYNMWEKGCIKAEGLPRFCLCGENSESYMKNCNKTLVYKNICHIFNLIWHRYQFYIKIAKLKEKFNGNKNYFTASMIESRANFKFNILPFNLNP